jgi:hypothetical protein
LIQGYPKLFKISSNSIQALQRKGLKTICSRTSLFPTIQKNNLNVLRLAIPAIKQHAVSESKLWKES